MQFADHCCVLCHVGLQGTMTAASGRGMLAQPVLVKMVPGEAEPVANLLMQSSGAMRQSATAVQ
jgi:hypothetical protein